MHRSDSMACAVIVLAGVWSSGVPAFGAPGSGDAALTPVEPVAASVGRFEIIGASHAAYLVESGRAHVLDTRPIARHLAGHIPGAVHLDDECLRESVSGMPARYLGECDLAKVFEKAGVTVDRSVVIYADADDPLAATMAAYALLKIGHPRVMVLDGGFDAWAGNHPVTQGYAAYGTTPWAGAPVSTLAATVDDARAMSASGEGRLIDARPARVFRGETRTWVRNGHIPGAVNLDWTALVRSDNQAMFRPRAEIEKLLKDAGLDPRVPTIVYCGTGREATLLYTYLRGVLEWPRVRLYEGSWTEWSSRPDLPIATGDAGATEFFADNDVLIGGQPSAEQLREMADRGVTMVINCRTATEGSNLGFSEASLAKKLGMVYVEIPLGGSEGYDPEDVAALSGALQRRTGDGTTVLHCASGGRAAQLWLAHLVKTEGMALDAAQDRLRAIGLIRPSAIERLTGHESATTLRP